MTRNPPLPSTPLTMSPFRRPRANGRKLCPTYGTREWPRSTLGTLQLTQGRDYYEKSDAERRLVHKMDCGILTCLAFGYLMKYIDQTK